MLKSYPWGVALCCFSIILYTLAGCVSTVDQAQPPAPAVPPAIAQQQNAVDSFAQQDGKDPSSRAQVAALLARNHTLENQYEAADRAAKQADVRLAADDQKFVDAEWAFWIDMVAAASALAGVAILTILIVESGGAALLAFGLVEKCAFGCATFAALLFTIAHYISYFKYVPLMIGLGAAGVIGFIFVTHHGAKALAVFKDIVAKGRVEVQHLENSIVGWLAGKAAKPASTNQNAGVQV